MACRFEKAWVGPCKKLSIGEFCEDHLGKTCSSCGAQATGECNETMGLVCGMPLCDDCEHEIAPDGTNGRTLKHCKKNEQKYQPWYMTEEW